MFTTLMELVETHTSVSIMEVIQHHTTQHCKPNPVYSEAQDHTLEEVMEVEARNFTTKLMDQEEIPTFISLMEASPRNTVSSMKGMPM